MKSPIFLLSLVFLCPGRANAQQPQRPPDKLLVTTFEKAMIAAPPKELGLDPFYQKYADAFGIPIVSSENVDDAAVLMARDIVNYMLMKRPDVRDVMVS